MSCCKAAKPSHSQYLDISAVGGEVHLHHKAGDVPAAVDTVQLWAKRQVVEVNGTLRRADGQVTGVWAEPMVIDPCYKTPVNLGRNLGLQAGPAH